MRLAAFHFAFPLFIFYKKGCLKGGVRLAALHLTLVSPLGDGRGWLFAFDPKPLTIASCPLIIFLTNLFRSPLFSQTSKPNLFSLSF
jgi:hypothetical protein